METWTLADWVLLHEQEAITTNCGGSPSSDKCAARPSIRQHPKFHRPMLLCHTTSSVFMSNCNLKHFSRPILFPPAGGTGIFISFRRNWSFFSQGPLENLYSIINSLKTPPCQTSCLTLGKATTVSGLISSSVSIKDDNVTLSGVPHRVVKRSKWIINIKVCSKLQMQ